jgi:hypothetical protein
MRVFAQSLNLGGAPIQGPLGPAFADIGSVIAQAMPYVVAFAGFGLLIMIIAAGFTLLTSAGDAKKMEQGKQRFTMAIVGFLIVVGSVFLVRVIGIVLGIAEVNTIFR